MFQLLVTNAPTIFGADVGRVCHSLLTNQLIRQHLGVHNKVLLGLIAPLRRKPNFLNPRIPVDLAAAGTSFPRAEATVVLGFALGQWPILEIAPILRIGYMPEPMES